MNTAKINRGIGWMLVVVIFLLAMESFSNNEYGFFALYSLTAATIINLIRDQRKLLRTINKTDPA